MRLLSALILICGLTTAGGAAEPRIAYRCAEPSIEPPQALSIARPGEKRETAPQPPPAPPVQILGCVEEDVALVPAAAGPGELAMIAAERNDAEVAGAVRRFRSSAERDATIRGWLERHRAGESRAEGSRMFIAGRVVAALAPGAGAQAYAIFPEDAEAGDLCLTFVPAGVSRAYIPTLNNWCMDALDELASG